MAQKNNEEPRMARPDRDDPHSDSRGGESRVFSQRDWEIANAPTDPERRRQFRDRWAQTHLPNLPKKPGFHRCWGSTSHPTDTVARRIALGFRVLTNEELAPEGWAPERSSVKDGLQPSGEARWREMIGMECTEEFYQAYMREFHFDQPRDMARDIYSPLEETSQRIRDAGGRTEYGEGVQEFMRFKRPDAQFE